EGAVGAVAAVVHGVDDAAVDGLEAVAHVREGARDDDAHRVVEIGALHLLVEVDLGDAVDLVLVEGVDERDGAGGGLVGRELAGAVGHLLPADPGALGGGRGLGRRLVVLGAGGVVRGVAHGGGGLSGGAGGAGGARGAAGGVGAAPDPARMSA